MYDRAPRPPEWRPRLPGRRTGSVYVALADALARDIQDGLLAPGTRLPSRRALAALLGVNLTTISRAFDEARRRGLVAGRAGRGTIVIGRPTHATPAPSLDRGARGKEVSDAFVDLTFNTPALPAEARVEEHLATALMALARNRATLRDHTGYQPTGGTEADRRTGARWLDPRGVPAPLERVLVCAGAQHALAVALYTIARPGDTVLCETVTYPTFKALAAAYGVRLAPVGMADGILDPDALDRACAGHRATALFCMPTAQNPTAAVMPLARRRELAAVVRRHRLTVIEDDIYAPLLPDAPPALASLVPELTWYITGVSKALTPGLRVGYLVAPSDAAAMAATSTLRTSMWMAPPLDAAVVTQWVANGTAAQMTRALRDEAALRQALARRALGPRKRPASGTGPRRSSAVWHLWLTLPADIRSAAFAEALRRRGVGVSPSDVFAVAAGAPAVPSELPGPPNAIRLCLGGAVDKATLLRALEVVRGLLEQPHEVEPTLI